MSNDQIMIAVFQLSLMTEDDKRRWEAFREDFCPNVLEVFFSTLEEGTNDPS